MSRATLSRSLGSTTDPTVLIPGDPVAMRADADRMDALAADLSRSAGAVAGTEFGGWNGQARDAYVAGKDALHARLSMAANSIPVAAGALRQYAAVLEAAQAEARVLARQWRTAAACAPVEPGVLAASSLAPEQLRAQARYDRLLGEVHAVATAVATTIEAATTDAPIVPTFWNQLGQRWSEFWSGPVEDTGQMLALWWSVSSIRGVVDPEGTMLSFGQLLLGLKKSLQDPRQFAKDLIDWDTWATSPARALGSLAPDIAIAFFTAGVGAAAVRGARGSATVGVRAAAASAVRSGARAAWENSSIAATRRALDASVSGWQGRYQAALATGADRGSIQFWGAKADPLARAPLSVPDVAARFPDKTPHIETSGQRGSWNKALHTPAPDSVYVVDGRNVYVTDHLGRVEHVEARWDPTPAAQAELNRNTYQQGVAGRADRLPDDVGGHLAGAAGGGAGEGINIVALDKFVNGASGDYGKMEKEIRSIVRDVPGVQVDLVIDLAYPHTSVRPEVLRVGVLVDGQLAGKVQIRQ